jgi:AraC-like DNA-binding protein
VSSIGNPAEISGEESRNSHPLRDGRTHERHFPPDPPVQLCTAAYLSPENHTSATRPLCGEPGRVDAGDIHILDIRADDHGIAPTPVLRPPAPHRMLHLTVIDHGEAVIIQEGRQTVLHTGDITLHEIHLPYSLLLARNTRLSTLAFPRTMLPVTDALLASVTRRVLARRPELTTIIGGFITDLAHHGNDSSTRHLRLVSTLAIDMTATLLEANSTSGTGEAQTAMMGEITTYIEDHLTDPHLDPTRIALAHHMSVRALHTLFAQHGTTVAARIRAHRLERCYDALTDARRAPSPIARIALAHGFTAPAHFTRAFRTRYGYNPLELACMHAYMYACMHARTAMHGTGPVLGRERTRRHAVPPGIPRDQPQDCESGVTPRDTREA